MTEPARTSHRPAGVLFILAVILLLGLLLHVGIGSTLWIPPGSVFMEILRGPSEDPTTANVVVWNLRLPRALQCLLVGSILGIVGSAFQAQLRNPLADPYIVGVSSGAAVGGVFAFVAGFAGAFGGLGAIAAGFATGMLSLLLVVSMAKRRGIVDVTTLLLAGVVIGSLLSAIMSLILLAAGNDTNRVLGWLLGTMTEASWSKNGILLVAAVSGAAILIRKSRHLNAFAIGEDTASRLGVDVPKLRTVVLTTGTAMTAAAVGSVGIVGFLGLVAPHIARRVLGVDWRWSLAGSGLIGGGLLLLADVVDQRGMSAITGTPGMEVPVGIVTAVLGAPSLLILLRRQG